MAKYKLRPGFTHRYGGRKGRKTLQPGEEIELTPTQYEAFKDRFDPVQAAQAKEEAAKAYEAATTKGMYKRHAGGGRYNVYKQDGTKVNDTPLTMTQADEMMK